MGKGENVKKKKRKEKRWEEINISKVVEVRSLNLDLDLLWKDLRMKLWEIIEDYKTFLFSNFQKKKICFVRVMSLWRFCARSGFFGHISFVWAFLDLQLWDLIVIREYICERNFMSFGSVFKEIQASKVSVSVLKSIFLKSDISLWSTSIELKFWTNIEDIYLMCLPKYQGF